MGDAAARTAPDRQHVPDAVGHKYGASLRIGTFYRIKTYFGTDT
jgi:hypothetical protein